MAEGKKSVLLYCDLIHTVNKLPDDKAGKLFKHLLAYINDLNPVTDDLLIEVAFEGIKQSLKRDLKKYELRAQRSRNNGSLGGRPIKNLEKPIKPNGLIKNLEKPIKPDSDSDSDSDSVSDIKKEKEFLSKKKEIIFNSDSFLEKWNEYKAFRKEVHNFSFFNIDSENRYLKKLKILSNNDEETAIKIINQSLDEKWKGLFKLKKEENESNIQSKGKINRQTTNTISKNAIGWGSSRSRKL